MKPVSVCVLSLLALALAGCGAGAVAPSADDLRAARSFEATTGELEDRAAALTEALTLALTAPAEGPEEVVERVRAWVEGHAAEMAEVAEGVRQRSQSLDSESRRFYEEALAERMAEPTWGWADAFVEFTRTHPESAEALREALGDVWAPSLDEDEP